MGSAKCWLIKFAKWLFDQVMGRLSLITWPWRTKLFKKHKKQSSRLLRKLGCFTETPSELFFCFIVFWFSLGFFVSFCFLEVFLVLSFRQVFSVVFHYFLLFKALPYMFNYALVFCVFMTFCPTKGLPPEKKQDTEQNITLDIKFALNTT